MKYPELRLSMETALPPSIQSWLGHELEIRGIDSIVYSRYIVQLLQDDDLEELECPDYMDLIFSQKLDGKKIKAKKFDKHKVNTEERKKNAAIECLQAVSEEDNGIETLVEELCNKLKELSSSSGTEFDTDTTADLSSSSTDSSDNSSSELDDPAERYYAAFPALQGQEKHATCSSPFDKDSLHVWQKNPITNIQVGAEVQKGNIDSGNETENDSLAKSKEQTTVSDPSSRKKNHHGKKYTSKGHPMKRCKKSSTYIRRGRSVPDEKLKENGSRMQRLSSWPQNYHNPAPPSSPVDNELCHKVESLLKEILLPNHSSEMGQKSWNSYQDNPVVQTDRFEDGIDLDNDSKREESVSPELRENDSWYTQPLEALFNPEEPRHPLYKRHSYPLLVDEGEQNENTDDTDENEVFTSTVSSPLLNYCFYDNMTEKEDVQLSELGNGKFQCQQDEENSSDPEILISSVIKRSLMDENDESVCPSPPIISGKFLDSTSYLDRKAIKNSRESSASTSSSASYATVTERIKDWEDQKEDNPTPPQLFPVYETFENPLFMEMSALLDRDYLYSIMSAEIEITNSRYTPARQSCLLSPVMSETFTEDLGWPSKVLFDDQLHLPLDLHQDQSDIGGAAGTPGFKMLSHGRMFWQLWDVNYQNNTKVAFYPWRLEELWDLDCPGNEYFWSTTTLTDFEGLLDARSRKISLPLSNCFGNTLIPQITFDLAADIDLDPDDIFVVEDESDDEDILNNLLDPDNTTKSYNRSLSLGDFKMLWSFDERDCMMSKPQLSRSFELVPSEHSAFEDVPTKMLHVHSEPNLQLFRDAFDTGLKTLHLKTEDNRKDENEQTKSPEEHLYYSPKTHFRPIQTPVENQDNMTDFHLRDLFGGYSKTNKTPYQKYQDHASDSGEESFVPKFKICKDFDKYIQTGDEICDEDLNIDCTNVIDDTYSYNDREIDELVQAIAAKGCIYMDEGDGGSPGFDGNIDRILQGNVTPQVSTPQNVAEYWNQQACSDSGYEEADTLANIEEDKTVERPFEGDKNESIQNVSASVLNTEIDQSLEQNLAKGRADNLSKVQLINDSIPAGQFQNKLELDSEECLASSFQEIGSWLFNDTWSADSSTCQQSGLHRPSIWSSGQEDMNFSEILAPGDEMVPYDQNIQNTQEENILDPNINHFPFVQETNFPDSEFVEDDLENSAKHSMVPRFGQIDGVLYPSVIQPPEVEAATLMDEKDIVKVKLVYRKGTRQYRDRLLEKTDGDKILDPNSLMPMPLEAVYSSELEKEWLNSDSFPPPIYYRPNKNSSTKDIQRKPCSFFMEGNCRRADCKFAHDLSLITCKFWQDGDCFKGDMCPFLHGYCSDTKFCTEGDKNKYEFQLEDFPELSSGAVELKMTDSMNFGNKSKKSKNTSPRSTEYKKSRRNYRKTNEEKKLKEKQMDKSVDKTDET